MSSADLFEDGYPHGTPEGYEGAGNGGCRSAACPTGIAYGLSCKTAKQKSAGDYQYQKLAKTGATVAEIADALGLIGTATPPTPVLKPTPKPPTTRKPDVKPPPAPGPATTPAPETQGPAPTSREIRAWAREKGYDVNARGLLPQTIIDHYWEAHGLLEPINQPPVNNPTPRKDAEPDPAPPTAPAPDQQPTHPDHGTLNLERDLATALTERDDARDLAARLWDELDRLDRTRTEEHAAHAATARAAADTIDDAESRIRDLATALAAARADRDHLHSALAAASTALHTTERALELVLQKWDDATRGGRGSKCVSNDAIADAVAQAITGHDEDRLTCFDHDGFCCPCGGLHDAQREDWRRHQARAALRAATEAETTNHEIGRQER